MCYYAALRSQGMFSFDLEGISDTIGEKKGLRFILVFMILSISS